MVGENHGAVGVEAVQDFDIDIPSLAGILSAAGCHQPLILFLGRLKEDEIGCQRPFCREVPMGSHHGDRGAWQ